MPLIGLFEKDFFTLGVKQWTAGSGAKSN